MTASKRKLFIYGDIIYGHNAFLSDALPYTSVLLVIVHNIVHLLTVYNSPLIMRIFSQG